MIVMIILTVLATIWGVFLLNGKGSFLIAGYTAKSEEELQHFDTDAVCKFMGKVVFAIVFSLIITLIGWELDKEWIIIAGTLLLAGSCLFPTIYSRGWKKFRVDKS